MNPVRHLSVAIARPWREVYAFAGDPLNLPRWATGLSRGISAEGDHWLIAGDGGPWVLRFAPPNPWGVMDHTVVTPGGDVFVPMRVVANGGGCQMEISLYRQPEMDDAAFERDCGLVKDDLNRLKGLLEG